MIFNFISSAGKDTVVDLDCICFTQYDAQYDETCYLLKAIDRPLFCPGKKLFNLYKEYKNKKECMTNEN